MGNCTDWGVLLCEITPLTTLNIVVKYLKISLKHQILSNEVEIFHGFTGLPFFIFSFPCHQRRFKVCGLCWQRALFVPSHPVQAAPNFCSTLLMTIYEMEDIPSEYLAIKHLHFPDKMQCLVSCFLSSRIIISIVFSLSIWWNKDVMTCGVVEGERKPITILFLCWWLGLEHRWSVTDKHLHTI